MPAEDVLAEAARLLKAGGAERPGRRPWEGALAQADELTVIAEVKRRSPSAGTFASWTDPAKLASVYAEHGAAAVSCLTDAEYFDGRPAFLPRCREVFGGPVLRKDFLADELDVAVSAALGADAILLIVSMLGPETARMIELARCFDLGVLVEVHDRRELEIAMAAQAPVIGINNRDLRTFTVDLGTTERLAEAIPPGVVVVAESGIKSAAAAARMRRAGAHAVLVGESLARGGGAGLAALRVRGGRGRIFDATGSGGAAVGQGGFRLRNQDETSTEDAQRPFRPDSGDKTAAEEPLGATAFDGLASGGIVLPGSGLVLPEGFGTPGVEAMSPESELHTIKVCGLTRAEDVAAAAAAGATHAGFILAAESKRRIADLRDLPALVAAAHDANLLAVGVFVNADLDDVRGLARRAGLDVVQLHGDEDVAAVRALSADELTVWKALQAGPDFAPEDADAFWAAGAAAVLIDKWHPKQRGGTGEALDPKIAAAVARRGPTVLAGGLDGDNVAARVATVRPWGVDASSRLESAPGVKDADLVHAYVEAARKQP